ncbi:OsmC family protein [Gimibacter soli]|uniref:OsmC family protein n=1 Tax=Gimibacter soli TaxID=3024400 RepID=A0AAF0BKS8_9PROT|nr:OsmC family protein [Gimibacter soli]WCL53297.1 OsmC family protein [Gimibacter soli]
MPTAMETKETLQRAVQTVTLRPSHGQRTYVNTAIIESGTECWVEEAGHTMVIDAGKGLGGGTAGPTPSMIVRSALSSCVAIGIKLWAARTDVQIDHVSVLLETDTDARGILGIADNVTPGFTNCRLKINVVSPASRAEVDHAISLSLRYSPLMAIFQDGLSISLETNLSMAA